MLLCAVGCFTKRHDSRFAVGCYTKRHDSLFEVGWTDGSLLWGAMYCTDLAVGYTDGKSAGRICMCRLPVLIYRPLMRYRPAPGACYLLYAVSLCNTLFMPAVAPAASCILHVPKPLCLHPPRSTRKIHHSNPRSEAGRSCLRCIAARCEFSQRCMRRRLPGTKLTLFVAGRPCNQTTDISCCYTLPARCAD